MRRCWCRNWGCSTKTELHACVWYTNDQPRTQRQLTAGKHIKEALNIDNRGLDDEGKVVVKAFRRGMFLILLGGNDNTNVSVNIFFVIFVKCWRTSSQPLLFNASIVYYNFWNIYIHFCIFVYPVLKRRICIFFIKLMINFFFFLTRFFVCILGIVYVYKPYQGKDEQYVDYTNSIR